MSQDNPGPQHVRCNPAAESPIAEQIRDRQAPVVLSKERKSSAVFQQIGQQPAMEVVIDGEGDQNNTSGSLVEYGEGDVPIDQIRVRHTYSPVKDDISSGHAQPLGHHKSPVAQTASQVDATSHTETDNIKQLDETNSSFFQLPGLKHIPPDNQDLLLAEEPTRVYS